MLFLSTQASSQSLIVLSNGTFIHHGKDFLCLLYSVYFVSFDIFSDINSLVALFCEIEVKLVES